MANQPSQLNLAKSLLLLDPETIPKDLGDERAPRLVLYDAKNVLPTTLGYTSYFGTDIKLATGTIPVQVQTILCFRTLAGDTVLLALCFDGVYLRSVRGDGVITVVDADPIVVTLAANSTGGWTKVMTPVLSLGNPWEYWTYEVLNNKLHLYAKGMAYIGAISGLVKGVINIDKVVPSILNTVSGWTTEIAVRVHQELNNSTYKQVTLNGQAFRVDVPAGAMFVDGLVSELVNIITAHEDFTAYVLPSTRIETTTDIEAVYTMPFLGVSEQDYALAYSFEGNVDDIILTLEFYAASFFAPYSQGLLHSTHGNDGWEYTDLGITSVNGLSALYNAAWTDDATWNFVSYNGVDTANMQLHYSDDGAETISTTQLIPYADVDYYSKFLQHPTDGLYFMARTGIWKSADGGLTWAHTAFDATYAALVGVNHNIAHKNMILVGSTLHAILPYTAIAGYIECITSTDGVTWTNEVRTFIETPLDMRDLCYMNGYWYFLNVSTNKVHRSPNFQYWTEILSYADEAGWGAERLDVVRGVLFLQLVNGRIYRSTTGAAWTLITAYDTYGLAGDDYSLIEPKGVRYYNGHYIAVWSLNNAPETVQVAHSLDGLTWEAFDSYVFTLTGELSNNWEY